MKKKSILAAFAVLSFANSFGQCVPNKAGLPVGVKQYIVPDSAKGLEPACQGKPYEDIIYIKIFKDSIATISVFGTNVPAKFAIDSFIINLSPDSLGLPSYLAVTSVPAAKAPNLKHNYPHLKLAPSFGVGDTLACIKISGNVPAATPVGVIPLKVAFTGFADVFVPTNAPVAIINDTSIKTVITSYKINVQAVANCTQGVADYLKDVSDIFVAPNPTRNKFTLHLNAAKAGKYQVQILSTTGALVAAKEMNALPGLNKTEFDVEVLPSGLYLYKVSNGQNHISGKFTKE
jgi:Secretion system C-terminal sorting domain